MKNFCGVDISVLSAALNALKVRENADYENLPADKYLKICEEEFGCKFDTKDRSHLAEELFNFMSDNF